MLGNFTKDTRINAIMPNIHATNMRQLYQLLSQEAAKHLNLSPADIYQQLIMHEQSDPSAMGGGLAIPNAQISGINEAFTLFGRLNDAMIFNTKTMDQIDLVCLVLSPASDGPIHLRRLSRISRLFTNQELCNKLRGTRDIDTMVSLIDNPDGWMIAA